MNSVPNSPIEDCLAVFSVCFTLQPTPLELQAISKLHVVMGAYFTLIGCPYITSVELVDVSDMLYIGGGLYTLTH